jgi:hypothetical protein
MLPLFIFLTIIFHATVIFFLKMFNKEDNFEKEYIELKKKMYNINKINKDPTKPTVELTPIMKRIKEINELDDISSIKNLSSGEKKNNILKINKNDYSVKINEKDEDKFVKLCKKICYEKGHCNKNDLKKDFNKYLECRDNIELCYKKCY